MDFKYFFTFFFFFIPVQSAIYSFPPLSCACYLQFTSRFSPTSVDSVWIFNISLLFIFFFTLVQFTLYSFPPLFRLMHVCPLPYITTPSHSCIILFTSLARPGSPLRPPVLYRLLTSPRAHDTSMHIRL